MRMNITALVLIFIFLVNPIGSCATITRGTKEPVHFTSVPDNASVRLSNGLMCETTPCSIEIPRKSKLIATYSKEGCMDKVTNVENTASNNGVWMLIGNVMVSGIVVMLIDLFSADYYPGLQVVPGLAGLGVDLYSGASRDIFPNPVEVRLEC